MFDQVVIFFYLTSMMNFYLLLPRDDLDLSTLRKLYINFFDDEDARDRIFSYHRRCKKKRKNRTDDKDLVTESRYHLAVDEKNCLSGFTVTSTRALSKISIIANRVGEGLASRLPARTRIIVVLWWAPDTSLLSLRESLPLDSSLSLSRSTLSSRFRAFHAKFRDQHALANRTITIRRS